MSSQPSNKLTRQQVESLIVPGAMLYIEVEFPPDYARESKHMVVVGFDPYPLLLKIGTLQRTSSSGKIYRTQFTLKKEQYDFLSYDSYLNCGRVWKLITKDEIIEQVLADNSRIKGTLSADHKNEVCRQLDKAKDVARNHRRIIKDTFC